MVPITLVVVLGMVWGRLRKAESKTLADVNLYLGVPCLLFTSLVSHPPAPGLILQVAGIMAIVFSSLYALCKVTGLTKRTPVQVLAVMFPNAGNLGIPVALLAFGPEARAISIVFFSINSMLHFTWGFHLAGMKVNIRNFLSLPLIYAVALGLTLGYMGLALPPMVMEAVKMTGDIAIPLMLITLGMHLVVNRPMRWGPPVMASLILVFGGLAAAFVAARVIGATGNLFKVALVYGALPSAVFNVSVAEWAGADAEGVAQTVVLSTLISAVLLCVLLAVLA